MALEQHIKTWVALDNNIRELSNQIKNIRQQKTVANSHIINYITEHNLDNATIKISDGTLNFVNTNQHQLITYGFLYNCLCEYFNNDIERVTNLLTFIKNKRTTKTIKTIKRCIS